MPLRALRPFLLAALFAFALVPPPAYAQSLSDAELKAIGDRAIELDRIGKYGEAIPLQQQYAAAMAARHGENANQYATALNNLAQMLKAANRFAEAETLLRRVLEIFEKVERDTGRRHPNYAATINNLALLLQATNRLSEAEPLIRRALAIDEESFGPSHPNVAIRLNNLAVLLTGREPSCRGRALDAPCARYR